MSVARRHFVRRGFTLIELLVSMAVVGVLIAIALPAVQAVRESARRTQCRNNLKQFGIALQQYAETHATFPPGYLFANPAPVVVAAFSPPSAASSPIQYLFDSMPPPPLPQPPPNDPGWSWLALTLPFTDYATLHQSLDFHQAVAAPANAKLILKRVEMATCPTDSGAGEFHVLRPDNSRLSTAHTTSYVAVFGKYGLINLNPDDGDGTFQRNSVVRMRDFEDGTSHTFIVGERAALFAKAPWAGVMTNGTVRTTPGAPVFVSNIEQAPCMALSRIGSRTLNDPYSEPYDFFSGHVGQVFFLYADGTVRGITSSVSLDVLHSHATLAGGEQVENDF